MKSKEGDGRMAESKRHISKEDRKKIQVYISRQEQELLQKIVQEQGISQSDLIRDALRSILGYFIPSEDWDYRKEWILFWRSREEIEKAINFLELAIKASDNNDQKIDDYAKAANEALVEIRTAIAQAKISGRQHKEVADASALVKWLTEGRRPTDGEINEIAKRERIAKEKLIELCDRLFGK